MLLQELQRQVLQLSISDRWQLVETLLESLKQETKISQNLLGERRNEIAENLKSVHFELQQGGLKFSSDIDELRQLIEE